MDDRWDRHSDSKWSELGMKLGLLHPTLKAVEANHGKDVGRCLMECLSLWLTKADENVARVNAGPLTWQTLAIALYEMNENAIAEKICRSSNNN